MQHLPKVTVGIATYNHSKYLRECVLSGVNQIYENIEILILNDHSTDKTEDVINEFRGIRNLRVFTNDKNLGIVRSYNRLLELAGGDYFMILGDDDKIASDYVTRMVSLLEDNKQCKVALGQNYIVNENGELQNQLVSNIGKYTSGVNYLDMWLNGNAKIRQHSFIMMMARKRDLIFVGGFPEFAMGQHSDNGLFMNLVFNSQVGYDPNAIYYYRVYAGSYGNSRVEEVGQASTQFLEYYNNVILPQIKEMYDQEKAHSIRSKLRKFVATVFYERITLFYSRNHTIGECIRLVQSAGLKKEQIILFPKFFYKLIRAKYFFSRRGH